MKRFLLLLVSVSILFANCGKKKNPPTEREIANAIVAEKGKQLNITILLDLSDRIEPSKYPASPEHWQRDMAAVQEVVSVFKKEMVKKGNFDMQGKIRILFSPVPQDPEINQIAQTLNIDTNKDMEAKGRKALYKSIDSTYTNGLKKIYETTLQTKKYIGSDIWRFFKNDVRDLAEIKDPNYRNILVIITDGYLYHENTKLVEGNRYSYLVPELISQKGLNNSNWEKKLEDTDFGLINPRPNKDLQNLEVLVLEVNPAKKNYEEDILNKVLTKWFTEMGVSNFKIYQTAIPETTKTKIVNFFNN